MEKSASKIACENFIHNVKWLRKHYCLSKKSMAMFLKIGVGSLNKIENGEIPPRLSVEILFNIYNHFGILPQDQLSRRLGE